MGIKHLNRFLKEEAKNSIKVISLSEISGKKIAIDISIYMYKYASDDILIENMYSMLSTFRYYNIIPIFIFDGKPPDEKKELLIKRRKDKKDALIEYNILKKKLELNEELDDYTKQEIINSMDMLKRKFVHIGKNEIEKVKQLIRAYGATYFDAPGEADELCALLTLKEQVWGCLSEDMDMFVYGCTRVIRYFSLLNHTAILYDTKGMLENLGITQKELREICILSGTDYNMNLSYNNKSNINLYTILNYFKNYRKANEDKEFYDWLNYNTDCIKDYNLLKKIYSMFDLSFNSHTLKIFKSIKIINGPIIKNEVKNILKIDGFLFP
jgi:flap endonuclease-1